MFRRRFMARRQVGLMFTDQSSSKLNAQQAGITYGNSPTGSATMGIIWSNESAYANVFLYSVDTNNKIGNAEIANSTKLYVVVEYQETMYIVGISNNVVKLTQTTSISSFSTDNNYQWKYIGLSTGFNLQNVNVSSKFLHIDDNNSLTLKNENTSYSFARSGFVLQGLVGGTKSWKIYCNNSDTTLRIATDSTTYTAFLYSYSYVYDFSWDTFEFEYTYTLSLKHSGSFNSSQNVMMVVKNSSGSLYLVGCEGGTVMLKSISGATISGENISFTTSSSTGTMNRYSFYAIPNGNGINLQSRYSSTYYLKAPSTLYSGNKFTFSASASLLDYNDACGLNFAENTSVARSFGVKSIGSQFDVSSVTANSGTAILLRYNSQSWYSYYDAMNTGDTYAVIIRKAPTDPDHPGNNTAHYYLIGYDGTNLVAHEFATLEDIVVTSDCEFTATSGTNGCGLVIGNKGLNINNNNLAMLDVSADWFYIGDASVPDNSRLWTVTTQTTDYYTEYANSDLEANTQATDTTCDIFLVQNGKVQIQADEFVDGETYVLVFVDNGNHYAACVNGTDIVPVLYANSLPKNLPSDYHFVAEASGQGFILKHNNQAMGVAVNTKLTLGYSAVWTYTGGTNE